MDITSGEEKDLKTINTGGIVGMEALGLLYGTRIKNGIGDENLSYIMDEERYEKYKDVTYNCNGTDYKFKLVSEKAAKPVDLVMVCVKSTGLDAAIKMMKNAVGPDTIILSVMNGISSEQIIGETYGMEHLVYSVAQGMDAMKFGNELKYTKAGQLHIGITKDTKEENVNAVKEFFDRAKVTYIWEEDIMFRLWSKFMLNVGINQTCMVYSTTYSGALEEKSEAYRTFIGAMREVVAIANAEGVKLTEKDLNKYVDIIKTLSPSGTPSMGQDRINGKKTEVEMFAGTVLKIAKKHNILVPVNQFLYDRVAEIETSM